MSAKGEDTTVLTKDLILCKMANGRLKPQFVDTSDAELVDLAERLLAAYDPSNSPIREEIEELATQAAQGFRTPKLAQGILKIGGRDFPLNAGEQVFQLVPFHDRDCHSITSAVTG